MKKTLLIMVMALAVLLTQCRKPEVKFPTPSASEGVTVSMTVTAGPGSKTDITAEGAITWSSGDKLYVGFNGKYVGCLEIKSGQNTPTGWFSGNVTLPTGTTGDQTFGFSTLAAPPAHWQSARQRPMLIFRARRSTRMPTTNWLMRAPSTSATAVQRALLPTAL